MSCLFKVAIIHLKKNVPIASVLSFFVGTGITVLASSDNLISNFKKGFDEINYDSNPHDLILVNKNFKPTQDLNLNPSYDIDLSKISFTIKNGYKWSFDSNKDHSYIKASKKDDWKNSSTGKSSHNYDPTTVFDSDKLARIDKNILLIPLSESGKQKFDWGNRDLVCYSPNSFINSFDGELIFKDRNKTSFIPYKTTKRSEFSLTEDSYEKNIIIRCPSGEVKEGTYSEYSDYLWNLYQYYSNIQNDGSSTIKQTEDEKLDEKEIYEINRDTFNQRLIFKTELEKNKKIWGFRPILERDYYLSFDINFQNKLAGKDLSGKFKNLVNALQNSAIFTKLDDSTRQSLQLFSTTNVFDKLVTKFYFSSFEKKLYEFTVWLPMVKGMTFFETLILLTKLFLWSQLINTQSNSSIQNSFEYSDTVKNNIKNIVTSWGSTLDKDISSYNGFETFETKSEKFHDKSEEFIFSNLRGKKKLSDLDQSEYEEYKGHSSSGGPESTKSWCSGSGSQCSNLLINDNDKTLFSAWKELLLKWIDGNYKKLDSSTNSTNSTNNKVIPAFYKNSYKNKNNKKDNKYFEQTGENFEYYRPFPDSFEEVYKKLSSVLFESIKNYLIFLQMNNLNEVRKFMNDHNIFTLSFLLYTFKYNLPAQYQYLGKQRLIKKASNSINVDLDEIDDDFSASVNYHKSVVVSNLSNVSAKLNDPSKISHSFKVITQEVKDHSSLNRIKVLSGNPLFENIKDYKTIVRNINLWKEKTTKNKFPSSYEFRHIFKVLSRAKFTNPEYSDLFKTLHNYYSCPYPDFWTSCDAFISLLETEKAMNYVHQLENYANNIKTRGSQIVFDFIDLERFYFLSSFPTILSKLNIVPSTGYLDQFSSYFALVSPFYAKHNNIKPISDSQYKKFKEIVESDDTTQEEWEREYYSFILDPTNHDSIINVNNNKLIVVGTALTPDMMLPSLSWLSLVPNKEKEALVFVDNYGFKNIQSNSLSSWNEFYLSISYPQKVKDLHIEEDYFSQLNRYINDFVNAESSEEILDSSNLPIEKTEYELKKITDPVFNYLVFLRSNYVDRFLSFINLLSYILLSFVGAVTCFTVWTLIKRYISSRLNTFGVFVANGINRTNIIINSFSFILIPAIVGTVLGYFLSLAFQPLVFGLFSKIWYLNPVFNGFSLPHLLKYVFMSTGILAPICFISSFWMLKPSASNLMKTSFMFKQNKFINYVYQFFSEISSIWKFRISVILNTVNRGAILSVATVFLFVFSSFLFNNFGQFENLSSLELKTREYGFDMGFETPTEQTGQHLLRSYRGLGDTFLNTVSHKKNVLVNTGNKNPQTNEYIWEKKQITIDKDNPEIIASGLYSPYHLKDISEILKVCKNFDIEKIKKTFKLFDSDYPSKLFKNNPYNAFLLKSILEKKKDKELKETDCSKSDIFSEFYEQKPLPLPKPGHETLKVFYQSKPQSENSSKFNPDLTDDNVSASLNIADYVPVKNELWKSNNQSNTAKQMLKFGTEPLFKPLIDYYKENKKKPLLEEHSIKHSENNLHSWGFTTKPSSTSPSGEDSDILGDFRKLNSDSDYHPTLSRLFKDHSNYWLFSYSDLEDLQSDPIFFKNKVIMSFLFNHDFEFTLFGKTIKVNPWSEFTDFFSKYSPELIAAIEKNHINFVGSIIRSRYAEFFINRFMTKVENSGKMSDEQTHHGKKIWNVKTADLKTELQSNIEEGFYYLDPKKIVYFYDKLNEANSISTKNFGSQEFSDRYFDRFVIFRPDFLYLFYALMKDPDFLKPEVAPIKIVFNKSIYVADYNNQFTEEWEIEGDAKKDSKKNLGLTSIQHENTESIDYLKEPGGDQTYTYLLTDIDKAGLDIKIIGLKQDDRGSYIRLYKGDEIINKKLYSSTRTDDSYPVIINQFTAKKLKIKPGEIFTAKVKNVRDRFTSQIKGIKKENIYKTVKFKVLDIFDSYYQTAFFMSQKDANEILGLNEDYGFNGIFTKKFLDTSDLPLQLKGAVSGYSRSGLFVRQEIDRTSSEFLNFLSSSRNNDAQLDASLLNHKLVQPKNFKWFSSLYDIPFESGKAIEDFAGLLEKAYGKNNALSSSISDIKNASISNDFIFNTASDLVFSVINLFISIFAPLLVCTLLVMTNLIIEDLKNLLTILNLLGFTYLENSVTILLYLGLILGISTIISMPISSAMLGAYVNALFNNISIYLPVYLRADYTLLCFGIIFSMFGFSYFKSMRKIKGLYLPVAMKSLNE